MINFNYAPSSTYCTATYSGVIDNSVLFTEWHGFLLSDEWEPGSDFLNDLREARLSGVDSDGLIRLTDLIEAVFKRNQGFPKKIALCVNEDLQLGLSRVFEMVGEGTAESIKVFRDKESAAAWLTE